MKKFLKIAALVVAVLLAVLIVAPMAFRGKIVEIVKREANEMLTAKLDFESLDLSLLRHFPHASVELKGLTLVGVDRFEGDTIVAARRISVVVDLLSLFGDEGFEITKVILASPALHAHKLSDGAVNWQVMKLAETQTPAEEELAEPSAFRLQVRDFRISGATIRYEDDSTRMSFSTGPLSLRLRGDMSADETDLGLRLLAQHIRFVSGGVPLLSGAEAELNASIAADLKHSRFAFTDNTFRLNAIALSLDGWVQLLENQRIAMDLTAGCDKVQFKDVLSLVPAFYTKDFRNLSASGALSLSLWAKGEMQGSLLPAFELRAGVSDGSFQYSSLPKAVTDINIAAAVSNPGGSMNKTMVDLSKFSLKMAGNSLDASFFATNLVSDPSFRASVAGRVDLGAVREVYPLDKEVDLGGVVTADLKVSGRMSDIEKQRYGQVAATGTFVIEQLGLALPKLPAVHIRRAAATITPQAMTLGEFGVTVGRSDLAANGQLTGYLGYLLHGDKLAGRLYVKSELLDLNEILSALPASEEAAPAASTESAPLQAPEVPKNLELSLSTDLHEIRFDKMNISALTGEMRVAGGALSLDRLALQLFGGKASASGSYSTAVDPSHPALKLNLALAGASFSRTFDELELVQQLVPIFAKTGGDYSLSLDMKAALDSSMSPDLGSVDASGEIRSANIHAENIEAFDALAKALGNDKLSKIEAKDVAIRFAIRNGRVLTQPFDLKLAGADIRMSGSTGLDRTIDYTAKVALPASATNGLLETIDVKIGGTFSSPKITLGVREAAEQVVKNVVDEQIRKLTGSESLSAEIEKQAEKMRAEANEQADKLRAEARRAGEKLVSAARSQRTKLVEEAAKKGALAKLAVEKAGDKLVSEAEKQAANLTAEAEKRIAALSAEVEKNISKLSAESK
ncbi:MAG: AsmA family protein [Alistipes sp.]|nr:AsmA family protein [Alistipes senegalensis]MCM1251073.1 AsmA family protein [Alistipes sp.]